MSTAAAAVGGTSGSRHAQVAPAPQITEDNGGMTEAQMETLRQAELEAKDLTESDRTMGVYVPKEGKIGKITSKPWYIVDPRTSKFVPWWDGIGTIALLYTAVVTFAEVAFVDGSGCVDTLFLINKTVDVIFIIDMVLQFFLMYPQQPKAVTDTVRWVHDQDKIIIHYFWTWFSIDLLSVGVAALDFIGLSSECNAAPVAVTPSCQPWYLQWGVTQEEAEAACAGGANPSQLKVLRIIRVARLIKLVRLVRSSRIMKRIESRFSVNYGHLSLAKCLLMIIIAGHWYACIWGLMTTFESEFSQTWYAAFGYCTFTPSDGGELENMALADPGNETLATKYQGMLDAEEEYVCVGPAKKYVAALYWAVMTITSIGYGDIAAAQGNHYEQAWCTFLMLFGGMIWGSVIATFCGVIANMDPAGTEFRTTMDNLNRFMSQQGLPQEMRMQLREYFHQTRHLQIARANKALIENMSPMLQGMVVWKINEKWLRHVWFLKEAEDAFMVQLSLHLNAAVFAPAELCPQGYMYIIHRGIALYGGTVLTSGKVWGEDMILSSIHLRSKYAARCMTYVEAYMISRSELVGLAAKFPSTYKYIKRSAFRLGFRREMIRRAQISIREREKAQGKVAHESAADKMLVSVSSRQLDSEQQKEEATKRAELDASFVPGAATPALPPLSTPLKSPSVSGGGGDGATMAQVQQLLSVQEERLKKQNSEVLSQIAALATQLQSLKPA